ncbi:cytochrome P450 2U1-like [Saccoglossus kowalevskii]|uniref:Cytochrome P450 2U1-like n=1 Tax=Saccoglossus kowalevskii TaxID=10224 RepID=A0ABM0GK91_SACKO|nr:PREDICTED: cytochrome P450 2U1-like [Saccoglossus kowalevskii]
MIAYILSAVIVLASLWMVFGRTRNLPPGPMGLPLVGSILTLRKYQLLHDGLADLRTVYGDVFSMRLGSRLFVVLNGYDAIREAFVGQSDHFSDRPEMLSMWKAITNHGRGIVGSSGSRWKKSRKFAQGVLRHFGITTRKANLERQIQEESRYFVDAVDNTNGKPFEPALLITGAVANIINSLVFGERTDYGDEETEKFLGLVDRIVKLSLKAGAVDVIPLVKYVSPSYKEIVICMEQIFAFVKKKIEEHRQTFDPNDIRDFIDMYIQEVESSKLSGSSLSLDDLDMEAAIKDFFFAGIETTSIGLTWAFMYMVRYPEIQKRIQRDIDRVIGKTRQPCLADEEELPYVTATMLEVLRIASIAPTAAPHCVAEDTTLRGYNIPQGTIVIPHIRSVLFDPKLWPEPEKFNPERFLDKDGKVRRFDEHIPFSTGNRICLGEHLAKMEFFLFFSSLLQQFTFTIPKGAEPPNMTPLYGVGLKPSIYKLCVERR